MVNYTNSNDQENTFQDSEVDIPRPVRFWILLLLDIPSVLCSFFLLYHLLFNKTLRNQLTNHVIIVLLILGLSIQLVDIPFHLTFLSFGIVLPSTTTLCLTWWFMDLGIYSGCTILMAWGSIERYLLIFHDRIFLNKTKRWIFHYSPLILLLSYIFIFYIIAIFFPPCTNTYDYALPVCNDFPCYLNDPLLGIIDSIVNNIIPIVIISISSIVVFLRVYFQKRRLRRPNLRRRQRKMTIQLLCSSILYLIPNLPQNIIIAAHLCGLSEDIGVEVELYFNFLGYLTVLLYPFVCFGSLSELHKKIKWLDLLLLKQPRQIATVNPL